MKNFFDKLTGAVNMDDKTNDFAELEDTKENAGQIGALCEENDGELAIDVYDAGDKIIVQTMVAGVEPDDLDVSITRDTITVRGTRREAAETIKENYHHKELYWGSFSRTVLLPAEIDIEESEAVEKHGLLILTLPKIDKERKAKLKVR